jgi:hypothetical protein
MTKYFDEEEVLSELKKVKMDMPIFSQNGTRIHMVFEGGSVYYLAKCYLLGAEGTCSPHSLKFDTLSEAVHCVYTNQQV